MKQELIREAWKRFENMGVVVKRKDASIEAAIISDSFFKQKDPQIALAKLKKCEKEYRNVILHRILAHLIFSTNT